VQFHKHVLTGRLSAMRKLTLLVGVGVGFVLGSRAGKGPYEQLEAKVRGFAGHDDVQDAVSQVKDTAKDQASTAASKVAAKLPGDLGDSLAD
jgi:hypothetical protein